MRLWKRDASVILHSSYYLRILTQSALVTRLLLSNYNTSIFVKKKFIFVTKDSKTNC